MRSSRKTTTLTSLFLLFPLAALANVTGTPTLSVNTALSLDTGTTSSSGGDILWSGSAITPQGKAGVFNEGNLGASVFATLSTLSPSSALPYSSSPIPASTLVVGDIFVAKTNGGNYAIVLVTAASGSSISLSFVTFGASAPTGPTVTGVENNYSFAPAGFPNSGIAPSTLFVVLGTGLASPTASATPLQDSTKGLPTTLNGTSVKVTVGSTSVTPVFYYAISTALALVLPSNTPTGTAQLTVTYNNQTSAPFSFQVVQTAPGIAPYALNPATYGYYSYSNSIPPGTTVILYGSGLGADPATDTTYVGSAFSINSLAHIYVGGVDAPIQYQGSFLYPGLNQINVTIPSNAPTGCNVSLVGVTAAGLPTNFITLPIGTGACTDPAIGVSASQTAGLAGQSTVNTGLVGLYHATQPATSGSGTTVSDLAIGSFQSYTGSSYTGSGSQVSLGGCIVSQSIASTGGSTGTTTGLDAGTITATSPNGPTANLAGIPGGPAGSYYAQLPTGFITAAGGNFGFKGTGGANVGAFSTTVTLPTPLLTWTNQSAAATVTRSAGLPVTWSGGSVSTTSYVTITGTSSSSSVTGSFTCLAPTSAGQFTVPGYVLGALPAGTGSVTVGNETGYTTFTATGLNLGLAVGIVSYQANTTFN